MTRISKITPYLWCFVLSVFLVIAIWTPFGLNLMGYCEEWDVVDLFTRNGLFYVASLKSPLGGQFLRPLTITPFSIAYYLDPNSFKYWNIVLILPLILKGTAVGQLMWKTTKSLWMALMASALMLVYPADTSQFTFRVYHASWSIVFGLFACLLFLFAYESKKRKRAFLFAACATLLLCVANFIYEVSLFLIPLPFLLLYAKNIKNSLYSILKKNFLLFLARQKLACLRL